MTSRLIRERKRLPWLFRCPTVEAALMADLAARKVRRASMSNFLGASASRRVERALRFLARPEAIAQWWRPRLASVATVPRSVRRYRSLPASWIDRASFQLKDWENDEIATLRCVSARLARDECVFILAHRVDGRWSEGLGGDRLYHERSGSLPSERVHLCAFERVLLGHVRREGNRRRRP